MATAIIIAWVGIALVLAEGAVALGAPKRLPEIQYPSSTEPLLQSELNERATDAMGQIHALSGVPDAHTSITMPAVGRAVPMGEYLTSLITERGGAAALRCGGRGPRDGIHRCVVWAAMPQSLAAQLESLEHAGPVEIQTFVEQETARTGWARDAREELRIAEIHLGVPRARAMLLEGDYRKIRDVGFLMVVFGGVIAVFMAGLTYTVVREAL